MDGKENKHVLAFKNDKLMDQEFIQHHLDGWVGEMMGKGKTKQHNGQFILTNKRICFYRKGILGEVFETIPLEKISSVETLSMMGYRVLRCHTSNDELAFKTFETREIFDVAYEKLEKLRSTSPTLPATPSGSVSDELLKLARMKDQGILSEEEFAALKRKMIRSL